MLRNTTRFIIICAPFAYMVLIWILSSLRHDAIIDTPFSFDRAFKESLHLIEFGILYGLWVVYLLTKGKFTQQSNLFVALISIAYGFVDEAHQYFVPYRSATVIDLVKDTIGVLVLFFIVKRIYFSNRPTKAKDFLNWIERSFR
jgi:VanZ family protein